MSSRRMRPDRAVVLICLSFLMLVSCGPRAKPAETDSIEDMVIVLEIRDGFTCTEIEESVTIPAEAALSELPYAKGVSSDTQDEEVIIQLHMDRGTELRAAGRQIRNEVDAIAQSPKSAVAGIRLAEGTVSDIPFIISIEGAGDKEKDYILTELSQALSPSRDIIKLESYGQSKPAVVLEFDPDKLRMYNLSLNQLIYRQSKGNRLGFLVSDDFQYTIILDDTGNKPAESGDENNTLIDFGSKQYDSLREVGNLPVRLENGMEIKLKDICAVTKARLNPPGIARINQKRAELLLISRTAESKDGQLRSIINSQIAHIKPKLPPDIKISLLEPEQGMTVNLQLRPGATSQRTEALIIELEKSIASIDGVKLICSTGKDHRAGIYVFCDSIPTAQMSRDTIAHTLDALGASDDISVYCSYWEDRQDRVTRRLNITGKDLRALEDVSKRILTRLEELKNIRNIRSHFEPERPAMSISLDLVMCKRYGLDMQYIAQSIQMKLQGIRIGALSIGGKPIEAIARTGTNRTDPFSDLRQTRLIAGNGHTIALAQIAQFNTYPLPGRIPRRDHQRTISIDFEILKKSAGITMNKIEQILAGMEIEPGYSCTIDSRWGIPVE